MEQLSYRLDCYLPPAGDIRLHHVCVWARTCARTCGVTKTIQLDVFSQGKVLINFYILGFLFHFIDFEVKLNEL